MSHDILIHHYIFFLLLASLAAFLKSQIIQHQGMPKRSTQIKKVGILQRTKNAVPGQCLADGEV